MTRYWDEEKLAEALEIIKISSVVKTNIIKQTQEDTAKQIFAALRVYINEQEKIGCLNHETGLYLLDCVFDFCINRGYFK